MIYVTPIKLSSKTTLFLSEQPGKRALQFSKKHPFINSAAFHRAAVEDIEDFKKLSPIAIIVLLSSRELEKYNPSLESLYREALPTARLAFFPIEDYSAPKSLLRFNELIRFAKGMLRSGNVIVHCAGGFGRTGLFATALLISLGKSFEDSLKYIRQVRPGSVETLPQLQFLKDFADGRNKK